MVDVNSFTCSLIAFPTPLPPKKILTNRCNYPLHQQSLWVCNVFLPDIGDDWEAPFIVTNAGFRSIWLAACLTGRVERVMVHWAHPATLLLCHPPAICPLSKPPCYETLTLLPPLQYIQPPLILIGLIHFMFLWLYSITVSPLVDE